MAAKPAMAAVGASLLALPMVLFGGRLQQGSAVGTLPGFGQFNGFLAEPKQDLA
jgi:hypothetical protein